MENNKIDDGGSAYPLPWAPRVKGESCPPMPPTGMSLRDYFAGQALAMFRLGDANFPRDYAGRAYEIADAMLKARNHKGSV